MPATAAQVLHRIQKQTHACDLRQLRAQPGNHRLARFVSLRDRLEIDEHEAAACACAASETDHRVYGRVAANDVDQLPQLALQRLKRNAAISAQAGADLPGVLLREKAFRYFHEEISIQRNHCHQNQHYQQPGVKCPVEADRVGAVNAVEAVFKPAADESDATGS